MSKVIKSWLHGKIKPYFKSKGIELLKDDLVFIESCLLNIPSEKHRPVMKEYFEIWFNAINSGEQKKQNVGRKLANLFLLKWC